MIKALPARVTELCYYEYGESRLGSSDLTIKTIYVSNLDWDSVFQDNSAFGEIHNLYIQPKLWWLNSCDVFDSGDRLQDTTTSAKPVEIAI
ncbi:hypothetical protein TorRG33x02_310960 [Trema orientale]|uniref:Uncharacterized protein n=1 Tax=Trema orientale TaxID=63057 RepID=A0A2P5BS59_TREOI|nr:hypothetical protein TorRG33x02_310960 [Trema orientale]